VLISFVNRKDNLSASPAAIAGAARRLSGFRRCFVGLDVGKFGQPDKARFF
jgi:hypothetical protein